MKVEITPSNKWKKIAAKHVTFLESEFTQSLNRVQNVPNRLDNVDVVVVYYGCIQRGGLLAVTKE